MCVRRDVEKVHRNYFGSWSPLFLLHVDEGHTKSQTRCWDSGLRGHTGFGHKRCDALGLGSFHMMACILPQPGKP